MALSKTPSKMALLNGVWTKILVGILVGIVFDFSIFARERAPVSSHHLEGKHRVVVNKAVIAIVEKMSGPSWVVRAGTSSRSSVSMGLRVFEGDRLLTERSRLHVRYKDGTYVELGEESSFEVDRVRFKPANPVPANKAADEFDESVFRFLYGIVRVTAPEVHSLEHFTIKTVNAIVGVDGPVDLYLVQLVGERDMTIRVARGKVRLTNAITNDSMAVPEDTGAVLKVSGVVHEAGPFSSEQKTFLKSRTRI